MVGTRHLFIRHLLGVAHNNLRQGSFETESECLWPGHRGGPGTQVIVQEAGQPQVSNRSPGRVAHHCTLKTIRLRGNVGSRRRQPSSSQGIKKARDLKCSGVKA